MVFQIDIPTFFDTLSFLQGTILGIAILIVDKRKTALFLGLFILFYSADALYNILYYISFINKKPDFNFFPIHLANFLFPLFYIYIQQISILSVRKYSYWTLIPSSIEFVINIIVYISINYWGQPTKRWEWTINYEIFCVIFSLYIGFLTIRWINRHIQILKEEYSNIISKELRWAKLYIYIGIYYTLIALVNELFFSNDYLDISLSIANTILLYWVSIRAIMQKDIIPLISNDKTNKKYSPFNPISDNLLEAQERDINVLKAIEIFIIDQKAYKRPDLTIIDVAEATNTHPKLVSTLINTYRNQNFNTYINYFRIEKAKELLASIEASHLTVEGIGYEVGFKSKSAFYSAFKHFTQQTPSQFKKSIN